MILLLQALTPDAVPQSLDSVGKIVLTSFIVTEVAKKLISEKTPVLGKIPVLFFPLAISGLLTFLANKVFKNNDGSPFLPGNIYSLTISAIVGAAGGSGLFSWFKSGSATVGQSQSLISSGENNVTKKILLIPLLLGAMLLGASFVSGCQNKQTSSQNLALQGETLAVTFNAVANARDSGLVTQDEINKAKPVVDAYMMARSKAENAVRSGADTTLTQTLITESNAAWLNAAPFINKLLKGNK